MRKYREEPSFGYVRKEKRKGRVRRVVLGGVVLSLCVCCVVGAGVFYKYLYPKVCTWYQEAKDTVAGSTEDDFYTSKESIVLASDDSVIARLYQKENAVYVSSEQLPQSVTDAFVSIEDRRFYRHRGVDWLSTFYACVSEVVTRGNSSRGGSTITQQLVRNVYLGFERNYERKAKEILLALEMEKKYSKSQIIEFYANNINFANGYAGIGAASLGYYGKEIGKCSVAEIAFLCAIPNNPTVYNPRTNLDNVVGRRNLILREMYRNGCVTKQEYLTALKEKPVLVEGEKKFYNYESSYAIDCCTRYFMKRNGFEFRYSFKSMEDYEDYTSRFSEEYDKARSELYGGGYCIKTSISLPAQKKLQSIVDEELKSFKKKDKNGVFVYQAASTVIDNCTGKVVAVVGGRSQDSVTNQGVRTLNRAYQCYRQPGSTFKPLVVYTPSFEGKYRPDTVVDDSKFKGGPKNSGNVYLGKIPLRTAVEKSKNVVAWKLFLELGPKNGLRYVQKMKFGKITPNDYYASSALGGLYYGVNTVEMASAYAALANKGVYHEATCIVDIVDSKGNSIYKEEKKKRVYSKRAAETMTDVLMGVATEGTAAGLFIGDGMPVACKTGTTNNSTTGWFCGYTPYYSCAVYVGADDNRTMDGLWGATYPCSIWKGIEEFLCSGKPVCKFDLRDINETVYQQDGNDISDTVSRSEGIDRDEVYVDPNAERKPVAEPKPESKPVAESKPESKPVAEPEPKPEVPESKPKPVAEPEVPESKPEVSEPEPIDEEDEIQVEDEPEPVEVEIVEEEVVEEEVVEEEVVEEEVVEEEVTEEE